MFILLTQLHPSLFGSVLSSLPLALEPSWIVAFGFLCLITVILVLIWRRLKPMGAIDRIGSLAWEASGIPTYMRFLPQLRLEMSSARRYQRPLSLAVLSLEGRAEMPPGWPKGVKRTNGNGNGAASVSGVEVIQLVFPLIGSALQKALRSSDRVTYDGATNQYVIVFPQTKRLEGEQAIRRLKEWLIKRSSLHIKTGVAEFPTDGLIVEDLVSAARVACDRQIVELEEESVHSSPIRGISTAVRQ
jgi:hypothetical protein